MAQSWSNPKSKRNTISQSHMDWQSCATTPAHTSWDQLRVWASWRGHFCSTPARRGRLSDGHCEEQTTASSMPARQTQTRGRVILCVSNNDCSIPERPQPGQMLYFSISANVLEHSRGLCAHFGGQLHCPRWTLFTVRGKAEAHEQEKKKCVARAEQKVT